MLILTLLYKDIVVAHVFNKDSSSNKFLINLHFSQNLEEYEMKELG